jgi:PKD repeat protein
MKKLYNLLLITLFCSVGSAAHAQCATNEVIVDLLTDNYPGETSWNMVNAVTGDTIATSPAYPLANSTFLDTLCIPDGCYYFIMYDTYGDGICCTYGPGSMNVTNNATTLYSGGTFATIDSSAVFCFGAPPCTGPTASYTQSSASLTTTFTDASTSTGGGTTWLWDLGDGNTSTLQNPVHSYAAGGTYTVCLTVSDSCATDSTCASVSVFSCGTIASYTHSEAGLTTTLTDASTSPVGGTTWFWDLGDGNTSTLQNPSHTYAADGFYTVCLTITDSCATDTFCDTIIVSTPPCTGPTSSYTHSEVGLTTTLTDASTSTAGGTTWLWGLGDGNTSTLQNPAHTYAADGFYTVCLTITDSCATDTFCDTIIVSAPPCTGPAASFTFVSTLLSTSFTDASTSTAGGLTWSWDFGDGNTSTSQNPTNNYAAAGSYFVCLTVVDSCGTDTYCDSTVNVVTSINENSLDFGLSVYPNPTAGNLNVTANVSIERVQLLSVTGSLVTDMNNINSSNYQLDGSNLESGIYFLRVFSGDQVATRRVTFK